MIPAIIAAAGKSSRMGPPKQLLPWGGTTVLNTVVSNLAQVGVGPIVCVLGRECEKISATLRETSAHLVENPDYATTEMVRSLQIGLAYLEEAVFTSPDLPGGVSPDSVMAGSVSTSSIGEGALHSTRQGALFSLGDQPQISPHTLTQILAQIEQTPHQIVIPSHNMRRGHPFYLPHFIWQKVRDLGSNGTLRQLLRQHNDDIVYATVETDEILWDMDTPEQYEAMRRRWDNPNSALEAGP